MEYKKIGPRKLPLSKTEHSKHSLCCPTIVNDGITNSGLSQEDLITLSLSNELNDKFVPKHKASVLLSESYDRLGLSSRASRVSECGTFLTFRSPIDSYGVLSDEWKLHNANFCKDRLCPMCSWRRSYKIFSQVSQIMNVIQNDYKFLFLTLTVPNCQGNSLSDVISDMMSSFNRFVGYREFKDVIKGYFRALEITRNDVNGTYHPHFHIILAVPLSYGKHYFINRDTWLRLWKKAYRDDSITQVDIRVAKDKDNSSNLSSAVSEIAKYSVKSNDYLIVDDLSLTDKVVFVLSNALYKRRLVSYGGIFKDVFKKLKLENLDDDNLDLIHITEEDKINSSVAYMIFHFGWSSGAYKLVNTKVIEALETAI